MLSLRDITESLDYYLPRKSRSEEEVMGLIWKVTNSSSKISFDAKPTSQACFPTELSRTNPLISPLKFCILFFPNLRASR